MGLGDITDRQAVLHAIAEFDDLGRDRFLAKYGFGRSRAYWLVHDGKRYDSKAVVGAAHGYVPGASGPLRAAEFTGGEASVKRKLEELDFNVEVDEERVGGGHLTSEQLVPETVYTREDLRSLFGIVDATLNTGVFRPKGTSSVWLFITEEKPADRTQYRDHLEGDILYWQGQTSGRSDRLILDHRAHGLELLVFFRVRKYEYPGAGFRYLGPFAYVSHQGAGPTSFILQREAIGSAPIISPESSDQDLFDPKSIADARERIYRAIAQRRGQRAFRNALIDAYGGKCAITGCDILDVLEAAHIYPYRGPETNRVANGLLLRSDLHTLFDCGLIAVDPETMLVVVAADLRNSEYGMFAGRRLRTPECPAQCPSRDALHLHRQAAGI